MNRWVYNITIAAEAIQTNKVKSVLTALGIIFGVTAVISMLAIGNGARQEILDQMKLVGVNNIIIKPLVQTGEQLGQNSNKPAKFSPGLNFTDAISLGTIPGVVKVSPVINLPNYVVQDGKRRQAQLSGVSSDYFELFGITLAEGNIFNQFQEQHGLPVCIISQEMKSRFFSSQNPIGQKLKCGKEWLTVVGVTASRKISESISKMGVSGGSDMIYIPVKTMIMRYINRSLITKSDVRVSNNDEGNNKSESSENINQLDQIIIQVAESEQIAGVVDIATRMLKRKHSGNVDFEIIVPELLLKQQQRTRDIFNIVLGAIAAISLIVGGIGIMNIMLASVMERIKEIGIRRAVGATRSDIMMQFVAESTLISVIGGLIGVVGGYILSFLVTRFTGVTTIVSVLSVFIAFGISAATGIVFGIMPARKAAVQDPVVSLRTE